MSGLDLEEHPVSSPSAPRVLGRLAVVVGVAIIAIGVLVAVVVFGPFAAIRSIFVTDDPHWGTCLNFTLSNPCSDIPLATVETATGIDMPAGSHVVDSTASDVDFKGLRNLSALIAYPAGEPSPLTGPDILRGPDASAGDRSYSAGIAALKTHGVQKFDLYSSHPKLTAWFLVTGSSGKVTYLYVDVYGIDVRSMNLE